MAGHSAVLLRKAASLGLCIIAGMMLPPWEHVLPNVPDEELVEAARRVAAAM